MPIGITDEHEALRQTARRWLESRCPPGVPRALLDADSEDMPPFWADLATQGWLGLHLPEENGGQGYGLTELAVVLEEMGRAVAPGPFLPTALAGALVAEAGTTEQKAAILPGLADGSVTAAVAVGAERASQVRAAGTTADRGNGGRGTGDRGRGDRGRGDRGTSDLFLTGTATPVLGGGLAKLLVVPAVVEGREGPVWCVVDAADADVRVLPSLDATRWMARVSLEGVAVPPGRQLPALASYRVEDLGAAMIAAESAGGHGWCVETASSYAKVREQFGRPIGQFQAVKHRLADMLVSLEQSTATAWDAVSVLSPGVAGPVPDDEGARLAAAVAAVVCLDGFVEAAKGCIQVLGGVGFTWEHDAHLYIKRATACRQYLGGTERWRNQVARLALGGARRSLAAELLAALPERDAERNRAVVSGEITTIKSSPHEERRHRLAEAGYIAPHWPRPWGRGAGPVEQLVIDDELEKAHLRRPHLQVGAWALPTIIAYGTPAQQEWWVRPSILGELSWCQMFSEPGAGSDLASLSTKAIKVEGGWRLSGQKVWTSMAGQADLAICLARTDPSAPKHEGITYFVLDMGSEGIEVRPLRELTGAAMFNEVFLSDVFVPDDCVIGEVDGGWRLARTTLANERVSMSSGSSFGGGVEGLLELVSTRDSQTAQGEASPVVIDQVGALVAEAQALALLGHRATLRTLSGVDPGPESSVRKLVGVEHEQRVQELGLALLGSEGCTIEGDAARWTFGFLANRCLTIAGGTSEVQRNLIAERLLGLPRDAEP